MVGVAVASAATDASRDRSGPSRLSDRLPSASSVSFGVTTRSGSSVSVGMSLGSSVCSTSAFCSTTAGEAADASVSGPTGRSVGSRCGAASSTPISIAGAPRSGVVVRLHGRERQRRRRRHGARPRRARPIIQSGRDRCRGGSRSDILRDRRSMVLTSAGGRALRRIVRRTPSSATSAILL